MAAKHIVSIGENRGTPRLWIQSKTWLSEAGFTRGQHFNVSFEQGKVVIALNDEGKRTVSGKADGTCIIDMNTVELAIVGPVGTKLEITVRHGRLTLTPVTAEGEGKKAA